VSNVAVAKLVNGDNSVREFFGRNRRHSILDCAEDTFDFFRRSVLIAFVMDRNEPEARFTQLRVSFDILLFEPLAQVESPCSHGSRAGHRPQSDQWDRRFASTTPISTVGDLWAWRLPLVPRSPVESCELSVERCARPPSLEGGEVPARAGAPQRGS
jgi:hypothetical protein